MSETDRPYVGPPPFANHVGVCMKHSPVHNNRIQWMLNRLRDTLIPQKYVARFFSIICTCDKSYLARPNEDPWEDVQTRHMIDSLAFLDNHISTNVGNLRASVIKEVLQHLRRQCVLPNEDFESRCRNIDVVWTAEYRRTSVFRMLYLLQKLVEGNYSMLEPPRRREQEAQSQASDFSLTFELENFNPDYVGNLIGSLGSNILPIMKRYRCYIKIDKVPDGDGFKVKATIKKRAEDIEVLERIKPEIERWAKDTQELEKSYEDYRQEQEGKRKTTLIELLRRTGKMSTTADWNTMLILLDGYDAYKEIDRNEEYNTIKEWFEEIRENWTQHSQSQQTAVVSGELFSTSSSSLDNSIGRLSVEETSVKSVHTPQGSSPRPELQPSSLTSASSIQSTIQPLALGPLSVQGEAASQAQASTTVTTQQQSLGAQSSAAPVSTQAPDTNTQNSTPSTSQGPETSSCSAMTGSGPDCTTLCLVHDRRWMATFQYFLTQCYTMINLPRKHGYPLSQHICTCGKPNPDNLDYFWLHVNTCTAFHDVTRWLKLWPEETRTILAPLVRQLEKYNNAETWHSLFKLVYYYTAMKKGDYSVLLPGAVLAGVAKRPSISRSTSATSTSSAPPPPVVPSSPEAVSMAPVTAKIVPSLSSAAVVTSTSSSPVTGSASGQGGGLPGCICRSCLSRGYKRPSSPISHSPDLGAATGSSTLTAGATAAAAEPIAPTPPKKKLRKLSPSDWIDDCYFHGQKKKFVFQCIVNYLHRYGRLPVRLNIPFSLAVCCCEENVEFNDFFISKADCMEFCRFMREKLSGWRGDSKASVKPIIALLDDYIANENVTSGFLKFVYYFKKAFTGELAEFNQIRDELKRQQRNP